jgi:two-component system, OmpR family, torCAD operon response regulator TorR
MMAATEKRDARTAGRRKRSLLFVLEDDPYARDLLVEVAGDAGWDVRWFASIPSMRRALRDASPDLVVVDDDVADGRGGDFAREVRDDGGSRRLGIILLTDAAPSRRAELAKWASVIAKPFKLADLEQRLSVISGRYRAGRAQPTVS